VCPSVQPIREDALPAGSFPRFVDGARSPISTARPATILPGSYGVNLLGYEFLQGVHERGRPARERARPVLGSYPSLISENAARLARISGKAEVSFHMSGTEAVMQAVRLARYHTRRSPSRAFLRRLPWLVG